MKLNGPNQEDRRKLHAEINQIVNQRLSLMILSVTIFGVFLAWLTPKSQPVSNVGVGSFIYLGSILLIIILFIIFLMSHYLSGMLRVFSTYLSETDGSGWEKDWAIFRKNYTYIGYTKPQTIIFLVLGSISTIFPLFLSLAYSLKIEPLGGFLPCMAIGVLYFIIVFGMGTKKWFDKEADFKRKWKELNRG